jgi:ketosteroid isomerase-like protein
MNRLVILSSAILIAGLTIHRPRVTVAQTQEKTELEIKSLDARRLEALTQGDLQALDRILSKDLVYTHASGWRQTKAEFLASIRSGELRYHAFVMHDVSMRGYGNALIVTGDAAAKVKAKGQELDVSLLFLEAYVKQEGRWQLVAWQSTRSEP